MDRTRCMCGDSECPSCGEAQGTRTRKRQPRKGINEAITRLAALYPCGAFQADTDPAAFLDMVADEVAAKRRLMSEAVREFHGRSVLFSSAFLLEEKRAPVPGEAVKP